MAKAAITLEGTPLRCVQLHDNCFVPGLGEIPKVLAASGVGADQRVTALARTDLNTISIVYKNKLIMIPWTLVKVAEPV